MAAACLKGFYLHQSSLGVNVDLGQKLDRHAAAVAQLDRHRSLLGHVKSATAGEPARAEGTTPPTPEDAARRDEGEATGDGEHGPRPVAVTWLADGGLRDR